MKQYILKEGVPVPFLQDLGVMTEDGKIVHARYDKFGRSTGFLEFIEDILPQTFQRQRDYNSGFWLWKVLSYICHVLLSCMKLKGYDIYHRSGSENGCDPEM